MSAVWWLLGTSVVALVVVLAAARAGRREDVAAGLVDGFRIGCRVLSGDPDPTASPADIPGLLCFPEGSDAWLCRYPAYDGHDIHIPYVEGEYLL